MEEQLEEVLRWSRQARLKEDAAEDTTRALMPVEATGKRNAAEGALWERLGQLAAIEERLAGNRSRPTSPDISPKSQALTTIFESDKAIPFVPPVRDRPVEKE